MNEQTKELIAIGASIAAHCQPCLKFHYAKARELGIDVADIHEAIDMGRRVERGADKAMRECQGTLITDTTEKESATGCCGQDTENSGEGKCC